MLTVFSNGTDGTIAIAETTVGTPGPGLYAAYNDSNSDGTQVAKAILEHDVTTDLSGREVLEYGVGDQTTPAFVHGYFLCSQLVGLDANAVADLGGLSQGSAFTDVSAVLNVYKM